MVTVTKARGCADFGRLEMKNIADAEITPSFLGTVIEEEIDTTPSHHPQIKVLECALMPDHVHVLMEATAALDIHFGEIVRVIKAAATSRIRKMCANPSLTVFNEGFHDRIVLGADQLSTLFRYLRDNPRRLAVRRAHPEYFRRVNKLQLCGCECMAYGNFQLLDNPFKEAVVVHRADSDAVRGEKSGLWHYTAANGGVLVSPFISEAEKAVRDDAEACDGKVILLTAGPLGERYKPAEHDFLLCEAGKLLIVSLPSRANSPAKNVSP